MIDQELDPITFGVLRHKLDAIIDEAYYTIGQVSGNPVVYEAGDHQEAICTADGDLAVFGAGVLHWTKSIGAGVRHVSKTFSENPGIQEDDQYLLNDPYVAAIHASDVQLLAPIFYEGELIAWAGSASHQTDVGGIDPGSICVSAQEVFQEGFQTPGIKLVEGGVIRRDVEEMYRNIVRAPELGLLDIRAKIAANNVVKRRIVEMADRYGRDTVLALFGQLIRYSEDRVTAKLSKIPDGRWTAVNYIEGLREPYLKVRITAIKEGDRLTLDFTGTSPQTAGSENMGVNGTMSSAMNPFISMLCYDIPWNEGLFKRMDFVLPEGSLVNPRKPAAVSANVPAGANILTMTTSLNVLSKMLYCSDEYREEASGNVAGNFNCFNFSGANRDGSYFSTLIMDVLASGVGAYPGHDGANAAQNTWSVKTMIANVETNEMLYPFMYLWRKMTPDSGGSGKFRGGVGLEDALMPWGTDQIVTVALGVGSDPRSCPGFSGGYPAANTPLGVMRGARVKESVFDEGRVPATLNEIPGDRERLAPKGVSILGKDDVLYAYVGSGGGGFGDPTERDPEMVRSDVLNGYVSAVAAESVYGVILTPYGERVDGERTAERRRAILQDRLERMESHAASA